MLPRHRDIPTEATQAVALSPTGEELSMRWYRFLTRIGLWICGSGVFVVGIIQLMGVPYLLMGTDSMLVYGQYPLLLLADLIYGVCLLGFGVLLILARFRLAAFKAGALRLFYTTYALCSLTPLLYSFVVGRLVGAPAASLLGVNELFQLLGAAAGLALNVIYFQKRSHLFFY